MIKRLKTLTAAATLAALVPAQIASAQACIEPQDLSDAVVFSMPIAYSAFTEKCSGELASDGFVALEGDAFIAQYSSLQESTWPGAYAFFKVFAAKDSGENEDGKGNEMDALFDNMPPEVLRPFFELIISAKLAEEIKVEDCRKIERLIEPLAPLPPENLGSLIVTIMDIIPEKREPNLCPIAEK